MSFASAGCERPARTTSDRMFVLQTVHARVQQKRPLSTPRRLSFALRPLSAQLSRHSSLSALSTLLPFSLCVQRQFSAFSVQSSSALRFLSLSLYLFLFLSVQALSLSFSLLSPPPSLSSALLPSLSSSPLLQPLSPLRATSSCQAKVTCIPLPSRSRSKRALNPPPQSRRLNLVSQSRLNLLS